MEEGESRHDILAEMICLKGGENALCQQPSEWLYCKATISH